MLNWSSVVAACAYCSAFDLLMFDTSIVAVVPCLVM